MHLWQAAVGDRHIWWLWISVQVVHYWKHTRGARFFKGGIAWYAVWEQKLNFFRPKLLRFENLSQFPQSRAKGFVNLMLALHQHLRQASVYSKASPDPRQAVQMHVSFGRISRRRQLDRGECLSYCFSQDMQSPSRNSVLFLPRCAPYPHLVRYQRRASFHHAHVHGSCSCFMLTEEHAQWTK